MARERNWVGRGVVRELQPEDPRQIGPYRLIGELGAGGMGRVFLGLSAGGRRVAVKVIHPQLAAQPEFRTRFRREVAAARKVNGLFTAMVVDADVDGQVPWLATAYVAGPSLAEAVREHGPLSVSSSLALAAGLAESLAAIHAAGVVHRDLKPMNVLLAGDGPRVIDFGISRAAEATWLTEAGIVMGSAGFMSPEQAEGHEVGPPSDIFSLGAVLTFAATGEGPFGDGSSGALAYRVVHTPANLDQVPEQLRPLISRCLAKEPGARPTADEILADIGPVQPEAGWLPGPVLSAYAGDPEPAGTPAQAETPVQAETPAPAGTPASAEASALASTPAPAETPASAGDPARAGTPVLAGAGASTPGGAGRSPVPPSQDGPTVVSGGPRLPAAAGAAGRGWLAPHRSRRRLTAAAVIAVLVVAGVVAGVTLTGGGTPRAAARARVSAKAPVSAKPLVSAKSPAAPAGWIFATPDSVDGNPAVADGTVYVGDDNGTFYALDAATGAPRWKLSTGASIISRPAIVDGAVYVGSENNDVYALDAATGAVRWKTDTTGNVDSGPAVVDGVVYVGNDNNEVFALDAATGAIRWTQQTGDNVTTNPVVANGTVYLGCEDNSVYALNAATGAVRWDRATGGPVNSSPAVSGGTVFVGSDDGKVYALDAATGAVDWATATSGKVDSGPAVSGGTVFVGGGDSVYALNAATGAVEWTRHTGGAVTSSPAVSGGTVFVGSDDGYVYALDAATGAIQWQRQTGGDVNSSPVVAGGRVYAGTDNDAVYAMNTATGS